MRILFISAFYPPYEIGGWEQLTQEIKNRLQERNHSTHVLTSNYKVNVGAEIESGIERILSLESDLHHYNPWDFFIKRRTRHKNNLHLTKKTLQAFQPDVIFVHGMWNLCRGIPWLAEKLCPGHVVYYVADNWPYSPDVHRLYWQDPASNRWLKMPKRLMASLAFRILDGEENKYPLKFERVLCVSKMIRDEMKKYAHVSEDRLFVVYNGIDVDRFTPRVDKGQNSNGGALSLLYAGSLVHHKGVHTTLEAMRILVNEMKLKDIKLTIVGSGNQEYEAYLRSYVNENDLEGNVSFLGRVDRSQMPMLLQKFKILLFPSIWEEPLARIMQEAMAMGLIVIGTLTGGSKELLVEGETGLTFEPNNPQNLAQRIEQIYINPDLSENLSHNSRQVVLMKFDIRRTVDEIEEHLFNTLWATKVG